MSYLWTLATFVVVVYLVLYVIDSCLKKCWTYPYVIFVQKSGFEIRLFQLKWYTFSFNRIFSRIGTWRPGILRVWFTAGAWVSAFLVFPALILLLKTLISAILSHSSGSPPETDRITLQVKNPHSKQTGKLT